MKSTSTRCALLDELRGLDLISMMLYHGMWDLVYLFGVRAPWYGSWQGELWQQSICWVFILLSGFCLPLGRHPVKRGAVVFGCGALVTAVTLIFMPADAVWFGVLTLLGSVYGDNVIEKHGINRDRTGDREKTRYLCGKQGIFTRDRALIRPGFIRQLETRASTRSASFFHALGSPGRPHNGGGAAGAYRTRNGAKPLKQGHLRAKRGPLGPSRKSQQQTKRTGFAAHGHSIAETAPEGKRAKRAKRANGALIRA